MPSKATTRNDSRATNPTDTQTTGNPVSNAAASALGSLSSTVDFVKQTWAGFGLPAAMAPTVDVAELDKKITDLKAVEQWLEVNQSLLRTSIQTLEVQRNTIAAVQAFGKSLKHDKNAETPSMPTFETILPGVDTNAWWNMLQGQFNQIAQTALGSEMTKAATKMATNVASGVAKNVAKSVTRNVTAQVVKAATGKVTSGKSARKRG